MVGHVHVKMTRLMGRLVGPTSKKMEWGCDRFPEAHSIISKWFPSTIKVPNARKLLELGREKPCGCQKTVDRGVWSGSLEFVHGSGGVVAERQQKDEVDARGPGGELGQLFVLVSVSVG
jgi:hypothetical protein